MLQNWSNFFALTGSSGATLVGLLFVVVTLNTHLSKARTLDIAHASMSPALYSFTGVVVQSMMMLVPWQTGWHCGVVLVVIGSTGLVYRLDRVRFRSRLHLRAIQSPLDRFFHNAVPIIASLTLLSGAVGFIMEKAFSPFAVAAASSLLLISGIYRTWGEALAMIGLDSDG
ncbi:MAG: hypothetical protein U0570_05845 [Phycisphaerales bacterium]